MVVTGRSESIAAPIPAPAGFGMQAKKPGLERKEAPARQRFAELLGQIKSRSAPRKDLMGEGGREARIDTGSNRRESHRDAAASEPQAITAVAVLNPDVKPDNQVVGREGETSSSAGQAGGASPAGAASADQGLEAAISELLEASADAGQARGTAEHGSGAGHRRGVPPQGGDGNGQGPDIGSITRVEATDGSAKNGSQPQGPGANLAPLAFEDLETVPEAQRDPAGGRDGHASAKDDAETTGNPGEAWAWPDDATDAGEATARQAKEDGTLAPHEAGSRTGAEGSRAEGLATVPQTPSSVSSESARPVRLDDLANPAALRHAIVEHVEQSTQGGIPSIRLVLHPEHLGEVQVRVSLVNGAVNAHLRVDNPAVSDAVQQQLDALRAALVDQGIKIDKLEVSVSGGSDRQQAREGDAWSGDGLGQNAGGQAHGRHEDAGTWALPRTYRQTYGSDAGAAPEIEDDAPDVRAVAHAALIQAGGLDVRA